MHRKVCIPRWGEGTASLSRISLVLLVTREDTNLLDCYDKVVPQIIEPDGWTMYFGLLEGV